MTNNEHKTDQATKRPWIIKKTRTSLSIHSDKKYPLDDCNKNSTHIKTSHICSLAYTAKNKEANAHLIVKAVNCHDELVEALRGAVRAIEYLSGTTKHSILYNNAKQALAKAGEYETK